MTTTLFVLCLEYGGDRDCSVHLSLAEAEAALRKRAVELLAGKPLPPDVDLMHVLIDRAAGTDAWVLRCSADGDGDCDCDFCEPFEDLEAA